MFPIPPSSPVNKSPRRDPHSISTSTSMTKALQQILCSMFFGTAISFLLYGVTCCQAIWYFRTQSGRSSKSMKALICFLWFAETLNCILNFIVTLNMLEVSYAKISFPCRPWTFLAQGLASAMCTFSVESFFIMRLWKLSKHKILTALALISFLTGHGFGFTQIIRSVQLKCNLTATALDNVLVIGTYGFRLFADGVVALSMCYMLRLRSLGFTSTRHINTIKIMRALILWSISTGMLTCLNTVLFLACYMKLGNLPQAPSAGIFYVRGGLYANAMLAQLNARARFQVMADATIPMSLNLDTISSSQRVNRESLRSPEPIPE